MFNLEIPLFVSVIAPLSIGFLGAYQTRKQVKTWYTTLKKPSWTPPNHAFGPVWTTLYLLMGYASYRIYKLESLHGNILESHALKLYGLGLILNSAWSILFFNCHQIGLAAVEIVGYWALTALTIKEFWKIDETAGILMLPLLSWISLASSLNIWIWFNNKKAKDD